MFDGFGDGIKNRHLVAGVFKKLSAFAGGDAGDDLGAVVEGELGVLGSEASGDALHQNFCVGFDEYRHEKIWKRKGKNKPVSAGLNHTPVEVQSVKVIGGI